MANRFAQRARKPNYTKEETETLLDQLILYGHFLFNKTQPVNNQQKADVWANIAMQVNSVPNSAGRTVDELKHRWQDMAQRARAVLRKNHPQSPGDANSTCPKRPVPFLNKILQIIGESHRDTNRRQEESLMASIDSTYSSDSSCTTNEAKHVIREESNDQNTVVDLSWSNGSKATPTLKRSQSEILSKSDAMETDLNKYKYQKISSSLSQSQDSHLNTSLQLDSKPQDLQFENKGREVRDSSSPGKSVSDNDQNSSSYNHGRRVRPQHVETLRSMVLDPESQLVMEVEESGGDERSLSTSCSTSVVSTHDEDNQYDDNGVEDVKSGGFIHHLQQNPSLPVLQFLPNASSNIIRPSQSNNPVLGPQYKLTNHFAMPMYQTRPPYPPHPLSNLEALPKLELDRRCVISQIRMQDQQTRYLHLKEKRLQLEIDILKGKCSCKNPPQPDTDHATASKPSSSPSHQPSTSGSISPCHLSISNVTSCQSNTLMLRSDDSRKLDGCQAQNLSLQSSDVTAVQTLSLQSSDVTTPSLENGQDDSVHKENKQNGKNIDDDDDNDDDDKNKCEEYEVSDSTEIKNCNGEDEEEEDESLPVCFENAICQESGVESKTED